MTAQATIHTSIVDRDFAEKFLQAVDAPMRYPVYVLFHEWWDQAPQSAIDAYLAETLKEEGAREALQEKYIGEPLTLAQLEACAPGTLGHAYRRFLLDSKLEENLGKNYRQFYEEMNNSGALDRLPPELGYMVVRAFQVHDFLHVLTGFNSSPQGELALSAFYLAQLRYPYNAMRMAVTMSHMAFVNPALITDAMDAIVDGWLLGRSASNLNFARWEEEIDTPLEALRTRMQLTQHRPPLGASERPAWVLPY